MLELIARLNKELPKLRFIAGKQFSWSAETGEIIYKMGARGEKARWSLLHETGHALLKHTNYKSDMELLRLEVAAWQKARLLAIELGIKIDKDHIEDCVDTYRDWLYKRSICPNCTAKCLQQADFVHYRCFNCHMQWRVSTSRFCRAYRSTKNVLQTSTLHI